MQLLKKPERIQAWIRPVLLTCLASLTKIIHLPITKYFTYFHHWVLANSGHKCPALKVELINPSQGQMSVWFIIYIFWKWMMITVVLVDNYFMQYQIADLCNLRSKKNHLLKFCSSTIWFLIDQLAESTKLNSYLAM